ncbi:MAG: hypothetical protein VW987_10680, partial [Alphaproteobacteria bacterium]
ASRRIRTGCGDLGIRRSRIKKTAPQKRATETHQRTAKTNPGQAQGQSVKADHALRVKHVYSRNL